MKNNNRNNHCRNLVCCMMLLLFFSVNASAQKSHGRYWNKFINIGYSSMDLKQDGFAKMSSDWGASFTIGTTYYLHKRPVADCLYFGLDAVWLDLNYCNFKFDNDDDDQLHKAEIGMQIGPSVCINPAKNLNIRGYFRYAPSFSGLYKGSGSIEFDDIQKAYGSVFVGGGAITYGFFGLGFEARFGDSKHESLVRSYYEGDSDKIKTKFSGYRAYISFRF